MKKIQKFYFKIIFLIAIINLVNCEKLADSFFSEKDDVKMGISFDKEIKSQKGAYRIYSDPKLEKYVQNLVNTLKKSPDIKRKTIYPYKVTILEDDKTINAFCTPGGFIYVYTGLLKFLENEASLAAVLAHEIAHAEKRHVRQRMVSQMGLNILISLILGSNDNPWVEMGMKIGGGLALLHNSRSDEKEADEEAFKYLRSSPYYRGSMSFFFDKISEGKKKGLISKKLESLISTHPIAEDRLKQNQKRIKNAKLEPPDENNLFERRYKRMVSRID